MGPIGRPETSVRHYHYSLHNNQRSAFLIHCETEDLNQHIIIRLYASVGLVTIRKGTDVYRLYASVGLVTISKGTDVYSLFHQVRPISNR
jgi:hypothetical protein